MTVGEKIQYYRKNIGLSQEELAQKILVSRQTISLWEMDKTLPTVDNLIRLKEVFSVSIDDILCQDEPIAEPVNEPKEAYVFKYEKADLQALVKVIRSPLIKRTIIFAIVCFVLLVIFASSESSGATTGLIMGGFLVGMVSHVKGCSVPRKTWSNSESKILQNTYFYEIFDGYFTLSVSKNGEVRKKLKVYFDDIEKTQSVGNYIFLQIAGQLYIIKRDALVSGSVFNILCKNAPNKPQEKKPKDKLNVISVLLFVLSVCSLFLALFVAAGMTGENGIMDENVWVLFLFIPIPISSIVFGYYLMNKGYKYKKNIIAGFIMAPLLFIYGSFSFAFWNVYSHSDEPILNAEQMMDIDIPTHSSINTRDWSNEEQSSHRGYIHYASDIYFEDEVADEFEEDLPNDPKWITQIPNDMVGITSYFCDSQTSDYYLIYNKDTNEFNKLPSESGTYVFINILYDAENNSMQLIEYKIEYIKAQETSVAV